MNLQDQYQAILSLRELENAVFHQVHDALERTKTEGVIAALNSAISTLEAMDHTLGHIWKELDMEILGALHEQGPESLLWQHVRRAVSVDADPTAKRSLRPIQYGKPETPWDVPPRV